MKNTIPLHRFTAIIALLYLSIPLFAQAPQGFSYQAVARDADQNPLVNVSLSVHFSILDATDQLIWKEQHDVLTNDLGLFSVIICNNDLDKTGGSSPTLSEINWGVSQHSLQVEIDDGGSLIDLGKSPLMAVPYALFALNSEPGPEGAQGIQGEAGTQGADGLEGLQGMTGEQGLTGAQGIQGPQGNPGIDGPQGVTGPQGDKGDKGDAGTGLTNKGNWLSGTTYDPGDYVFDRSTDNALINSMWILENQVAYLSSIEPYTDAVHWVEFQAPEGPEGPLGPVGPQGIQGIDGLQGIQGIDGLQGIQGIDGLQGIQGIDGLQGIQGDSGEPGDPATDDQSLTLSGTELSISGGNLVDLATLQDGVDDADANPNNEIQDLQLSGGQLTITNNISATPIDLNAFNETNIGWSRDGNNVVYVNGNVGVGTITPEGRLSVQGVDEAVDEPLFQVLRKDGYPVFAVYEDGVYAYTDTVDSGKGIKGGFAVGGYNKLNKGLGDEYMRVNADSIRFYIQQDINIFSRTKGIKGGFAVGGYNKTDKAIGDEFLRISPDSVRIYIDDDPAAKGLKGGFAVGGYNKLNKGNAEYFNISGQNQAEVIAGENRVVWYPQKNAFMVGNVLVTDADSVGENSMSTGYQSQARGDFSEAFGYQSQALGNYSTAIGKNARAQAENSVSIGNQSLANNTSSFALGTGAQAMGVNSYALGSSGVDSADVPTGNTKSIGEQSFALGMGSQSVGFGSFSIGTSNNSNGDYSLSMGYQSVASGNLSTSMGVHTVAGGYSSTAMGYNTTATGNYSTAMGRETSAKGYSSTAIGILSEAFGDFSTAFGRSTKANGYYSFTAGIHTTASAYNSFVIGRYNKIPTGADSLYWNPVDPLFIIGNGSNSNARNNALLVKKNGEIYFPAVYSDMVGATNRSLYIDDDGKIGYISSSRKYKDKITSLQKINWIYQLRPVNFIYKEDQTEKNQYGLIAEEVEAVNPEFVSYNKEGQVETVLYSLLVTPMIKAIQDQNEQLKEQQKELDKKDAEIDDLKSRLEKVEAYLGM